jgi:flagellar protein FliS
MRGAEAYASVIEDTTPPNRLVEVVLERGMWHIAQAEAHIARRQAWPAHESLMAAQRAVGSLRGALREDVAPELVAQLRDLYGYVLDRLAWANIHKDGRELPDLRRILDVLREAFAEAARKEAERG